MNTIDTKEFNEHIKSMGSDIDIEKMKNSRFTINGEMENHSMIYWKRYPMSFSTGSAPFNRDYNTSTPRLRMNA
jgi:hypothetical protein